MLFRSQYTYLKQRHQLVELRREQYTLRDSYRKIMFTQPSDEYVEEVVHEFDVEIEVLPLGLKHKEVVPGLVFRTLRGLDPEQYTEEELRLISDLYWKK